jgi:hypothetical protein
MQTLRRWALCFGGAAPLPPLGKPERLPPVWANGSPTRLPSFKSRARLRAGPQPRLLSLRVYFLPKTRSQSAGLFRVLRSE